MCDALLPHSCPQPIFASSQESTVRVPPKFNGVLETSVAFRNTPVLCKEIAVLLAKDAIEPVPSAEMRQGLPGAYGIRSCSHAARIASYETTTALATLPGPEVGMAPWYTASGYHPAVSSLSQESGAPHVPARLQVVQEVDEAALTRATRRCWSLLFLRRRREQRRSFPWWRARRRILCFILFCSPNSGTHLLKEIAISFSSGFSGAWDDSV